MAEPPLDLPQGARGVTLIETLLQDVRYGARVL